VATTITASAGAARRRRKPLKKLHRTGASHAILVLGELSQERACL
jgi:hypothetical protein